MLVITPLKSASHSEVRDFLYPFVDELACCVRPVPASVNFPEAVMNATRPQVLEDVVEAEREVMKYLVVISDRVTSLRHESADGVILCGLDDLPIQLILPVLPVDPFLNSG